MAKSKGSINGNKPPYLRIEFWASGELAFWRKKNPGSLMGYNVSAYEKLLHKEINSSKNFAVLDRNI